jgi:hypothetical protein
MICFVAAMLAILCRVVLTRATCQGAAMRALIAAAVILAVGTALTSYPKISRAQSTLVLVKNLDHIEHFILLEKLWKPVDLKKTGGILASLKWPELKDPSIRIIDGATVVHFSDTDIEHKGAIMAPTGYTICHADVKMPSVTCNGTFGSYYRTVQDQNSEGVDGLHYFLVVPETSLKAAQPLPGKCFVDAIIVVTFVVKGTNNRFNCSSTGTLAFQSGK